MYQQRLARSAIEINTERAEGYLFVKRIFDLLLSLLALVLISPLMLLVAIIVKLDSDGPILFRQTRIGIGGMPFTFYKFRTMYVNADPEIHRRYVQALIHQQAQTGDRKVFKMQKDPRITRVGAFLRRTSLDELPQLFNVLKGEMSLVGPRPPLPYEVQEYEDWHLARLAALPGITGLWQVRGRSRVTFDEMVRMDIEYIAQRTLWLDMKILLLTIPAVLGGQGAV